jgi:hypothetical protein
MCATEEIVEDIALKGKDEHRIADLAGRMKALEDRLDSAVTAPAAKNPESSWIKRNSNWFLPLVVTVVLPGGVILSFFHWFFADLVDHRIDDKLRQPIKDLASVNTGIAELKGKLDGILAMEKLRASASLPANEFKVRLGDVSATLASAKKQNIELPNDLKSSIKQKLLETDSTAPNYWQTAAAFVRLSSPVLGQNPPPCMPLRDYRGEYVYGRLGEEPKRGQGTIDHIQVSGCTAVLDGQKVSRMWFYGCRIIYRGGKISLGPNVRFESCEFVLELTDSPQPPGQKLTRVLLASTSLDNVALQRRIQ